MNTKRKSAGTYLRTRIVVLETKQTPAGLVKPTRLGPEFLTQEV